MTQKPIEFDSGLVIKPVTVSPTNPVEGQLQKAAAGHSTLSEGTYEYNGSRWVRLDQSPSDGLNFFDNGDLSGALLTDFTQGNDATFDNGGTPTTVLTLTQTVGEVIRGFQSVKWVLNATPTTSVNDFFVFETIDIPLGYRGRTLGLKLQYSYDGANGDIAIRIKDETNTAVLTDDTVVLEGTSGKVKEFVTSFYCPATCQQIKLGSQVLAHATGSEVLIMDDIVVTPDPFVLANISGKTLIDTYIHTYTTSLSSGSVYYCGFPIVQNSETGATIENSGQAPTTTYSSAWKYVVPKAGVYKIVSYGWCQKGSGGTSASGFDISIYIDGVREEGTQGDRCDIGVSAGEAFGIVVGTYRLNKNQKIAIGILQANGNGTARSLADSDNKLEIVSITEEQEHIITPMQNVHPAVLRGTDSPAIAPSIVTYIGFNTIETDIDSLFSNVGVSSTTRANATMYKVPQDGMYYVKARTQLLDDADWDLNQQFYFRVEVDGVEKLNTATVAWEALNNPKHQFEVSGIVKLNKDEEVQVSVDHTGSGPLSFQGADSFAEFSVFKIDQNAVLGAFPKTKWQQKALTNSETFNNLEIGKTYRVVTHGFFDYASGTGVGHKWGIASWTCGTVSAFGEVEVWSNSVGQNAVGGSATSNKIFVADSPTLTFTVSQSAGVTFNSGKSYAYIEELLAEQVTQWT